MKKFSGGFTIVELLIVIVVIAILAAISIIAYNGIQDRANNAIVQSDLQQAAKKLLQYKILKGQYPAASSSELAEADISLSKSSYETIHQNVIYCRDNTSDNYSLTVRSKAMALYTVSSQNTAVRQYSGGWQAVNVCPATGITDYSSSLGFTSSWTSWVKG